jgi:hypothetical protein
VIERQFAGTDHRSLREISVHSATKNLTGIGNFLKLAVGFVHRYRYGLETAIELGRFGDYHIVLNNHSGYSLTTLCSVPVMQYYFNPDAGHALFHFRDA